MCFWSVSNVDEGDVADIWRTFKQMRKPFFTRAILKTGAPNDNKITLNTTRSKASHVYVASVPESQIWFRFDVWLSVSNICSCV